jgi:tRNA(fMet)-specific endonuclease VapC
MMYLLDTDHLSLIDRGGVEGQRILSRLRMQRPEEIFVSIISYEEQMRGWLASLNTTRAVDRQELGYSKLHSLLTYYCDTAMLDFDSNAIAIFQNLWLLRLRIGTMDLKIAAIALSNGATLLTRNSSDLGKFPICS